MVWVSDKDYAKRLSQSEDNSEYSDYSKWYNDNGGTSDDEDEKRRKAKKEQQEKDAKKGDFWSDTARNVSNFTEEANKAFLGNIVGGAAQGVTWGLGKLSGMDDETVNRAAQDAKESVGGNDEKGLNTLEKYKGNIVEDSVKKITGQEIDKNKSFMSEEEQNREVVKNQTDAASQWGRNVGEAERIATDIATTAIPGFAAEKALRGTAFAARLANGTRKAKLGLDVGTSVASGAVSTAVGTVKDPSQLTTGNVAANTGIDFAAGLLPSGIEQTVALIRGVRNAKQLDKALEGAADLNIPADDVTRLSKLKDSNLPPKKFNQEVQKVMDEAQNRKKFEVLADGATTRAANVKTRMDDIDRRVSEVNTPEYQRNNGLMKTDEATARYDEIMNDPAKLPAQQQATAAIADADNQIKAYNEMRTQSPYIRKVDSIKGKINRIEEARQKDLDELQRMGDDPDTPVSIEAAAAHAEMVNKRYDDMVAAQNKAIDELSAKNPDGYAEMVMNDQALETVTRAKMDAETNLQSLMSTLDKQARKEADVLANTPDPDKVLQHQNLLEAKKAKLQQRLDDAQKRYENPNTTLSHVDEELMNLQEGSHPLVVEGASKPKLFTRFKELNDERAKLSAKNVAEEDPNIIKTPQEQEDIATAALEEVQNTSTKWGSRLASSFQQPANKLRAAGYGKLADQRTDAIITYNRQAHDTKLAMQAWGKQAKGNSSKDLFRAANGDEAALEKLTPGGRIVVEQWQAMRKELGAKMGLPEELLERDYYIPHLFVDVKKQPKLIAIQGKLKAAQDEIDAGKLEGTDLKRKESYVKKLNDEIKEMVGKDNLNKYEDFIRDKGDYSNRFLKKREGAEGYEENFWKAVDAYNGAANTKINLEPAMRTMADARELTEEAGMQKFLQNEIDKMRGTKADLDRELDNWFNDFTKNTKVPDNLGTKSLRGFRHATSLSHIGFSINSAVNTLAQAAVMPGSLNIDGSLYGLYKAFQMTGKLAKNKAFKSDISKFEHMQRMGVFEGSSHILPDQTLNKYANKLNKAAYSGITGADRLLRMATYEGAMLKGGRQGLEGKDLERYVYERVNEVNQNFSKLETPHAFRSQVAKTMGSLITFAPGMIVRSAEIGGKALKGGADIIGKTATGQPLTRAEFMKDVDDISKGIFTMLAVAGVGQVIGRVTGQDEVVPNPFDSGFYSSPALQFLFGSEYKSGFMGAMTSQAGDEYDENGNNVTQGERSQQFWNEVIPSFLIPGYSQGKRTLEGIDVSNKGFSETAPNEEGESRIRYQADPANDLQRAIFGQYSTPEGKEYVDNLGRPGGDSLSPSKSAMIKEAPQELQKQYYDFFRAADSVTGRTDANKEVTRLFKEGQTQKARRVAQEFNAKVDEKMGGFFSEYNYVDPELEDELKSSVYITLTPRSESSRKRSND